VSIRIQVSSATVKALHTKLQQAYLKDDMRLVRRTTVLIDMLVHHIPIPVLCERWSLSASCLYDWQRTFLLHGLDSLVYRHKGICRVDGLGRQSASVFCHAFRNGVVPLWAVLRRKWLGTQAGRVAFQKQT
jgi:hypothetical protein